MAYANLVAQPVVDKREAFSRFRDFLCKRNGTYDYSTTGIGWTLLDSSYANDEDTAVMNDWFVIYSAGENGKEDLYFKITWTSGYIKIEGYQAWNPSTHTGSANKYNSNSNFSFIDADINKFIWVYGDLDFIFLMYDYTDVNRACYFGMVPPADDNINTDIATCSAAISAGTDVSILVDTVPADWAVGRQITIRTAHFNDMATVKAEIIVIKTLSGNTITADISNDYTANFKLSSYLGYLCIGANQLLSTTYTFISILGAVNAPMTHHNQPISSSQFDPCGFDDSYILNPIVSYASTGGWPAGKLKHIKYMSTTYLGTILAGDVLVDNDNNFWRIYMVYNSKVIAIREV